MGKGTRCAAATAAAAAAFFLIMVSFIGSSSGQALAPGPSMAFGPSAAAGPSPSPGDDCMMKLLNMSDCLSYVTEGSNVTVPDKPCCPELAGLVDSNPLCLCQLLGKNDTYGFNIDVSRALKLPSVCGVTTPPANLCSLVGVPIEAPIGSPGPASPGAQAQPPSGLAASPSNGNNDSAASGNAGSVPALLVGLAVAFLI